MAQAKRERDLRPYPCRPKTLSLATVYDLNAAMAQEHVRGDIRKLELENQALLRILSDAQREVKKLRQLLRRHPGRGMIGPVGCDGRLDGSAA